MSGLAGKVAIITGGEGSIGMATARTLVNAGAGVFLAGISEPDLRAGDDSSFITGTTLAVDSGMSS